MQNSVVVSIKFNFKKEKKNFIETFNNLKYLYKQLYAHWKIKVDSFFFI